MKDRLRALKQSLLDSPIVKRGDYDYFVHPLVDGIPKIDPTLLKEIAEEIDLRSKKGYERIVVVEAMGIPLGAALSLRNKVPFTIIRKRPYMMDNEVTVDQHTGYSKGNLYINGLKPGMKVLLIDDVISTGGTIKAVVKGLRSLKVEIVDIVILVEKGNVRERLEHDIGQGITVLTRIEVRGGRVVLLDQ
jgi:adenine phosphoribosyltransferase